jgi:CrcB protein
LRAVGALCSEAAMERALLVAVGGMLGCLARYWAGGLVQRLGEVDFPLGTLSVNLLGSFVLGAVIGLSVDREAIGPSARLLLTTGFCSGFTTMSTFSYEALVLLQGGQGSLALGYVGGTLIGCLAAVWLGQLATRLF